MAAGWCWACKRASLMTQGCVLASPSLGTSMADRLLGAWLLLPSSHGMCEKKQTQLGRTQSMTMGRYFNLQLDSWADPCMPGRMYLSQSKLRARPRQLLRTQDLCNVCCPVNTDVCTGSARETRKEGKSKRGRPGRTKNAHTAPAFERCTTRSNVPWAAAQPWVVMQRNVMRPMGCDATRHDCSAMQHKRNETRREQS